MSFILVPIDFLYTTSYRLSVTIVTFALGRTDISTDDRRQTTTARHYNISATVLSNEESVSGGRYRIAND